MFVRKYKWDIHFSPHSYVSGIHILWFVRCFMLADRVLCHCVYIVRIGATILLLETHWKPPRLSSTPHQFSVFACTPLFTLPFRTSATSAVFSSHHTCRCHQHHPAHHHQPHAIATLPLPLLMSFRWYFTCVSGQIEIKIFKWNDFYCRKSTKQFRKRNQIK